MTLQPAPLAICPMWICTEPGFYNKGGRNTWKMKMGIKIEVKHDLGVKIMFELGTQETWTMDSQMIVPMDLFIAS